MPRTQRTIRTTIPDIGTITFALQSRAPDDPQLTGALFSACHKMLRKIAHGARRRAPTARTLQTTMLVDEAFIKLAHRKRHGWTGSGHFVATVTKAMHNIVIDHLRTRTRGKRHGSKSHVSFNEYVHAIESRAIDVVALRDSLDRFEKQYPGHAAIVQLRFFAGFTIPEVAALLRLDERTVERRWQFARAWLHAELS